MPLILASLACGFLFGAGLMISGMTDPTRVLGFLDVFGHWDPTLAFVMAGALAVSAAGYALARQRKRPVFAAKSAWPARKAIDKPLIVGAVMFGAGWGLVGLCPGPALENLATASPQVVLFVAAMVLGMLLEKFWEMQLAPKQMRQRAATGTASDG
jgi:uncharacterized membrane protein YedE/YeeE